MRARPGILKHRVTWQQNSVTPSDYAENEDSWSDIETVYADVRPLTTKEALHAGQPAGKRIYHITMRHRGDTLTNHITYVSGGAITYVSGDDMTFVARGSESQAHRLVYDGRYLEVLSTVDLGESHKWTEILAQEAIA